ncbi:FG-GAP-like repeat-containing protein [Flavivirga abyssicola]|uniref:VCBS repeat-containing protein n=1 Tax=Flavivirga abyssicola TaxID=3063533 RepID=UPI0026E090DD|nr:FG-GAP-like repeat-containing protein [Flavivirga sp. MEBiC07777]WVK14773.1 FG-GAP-like repeat-containing protein [Flavivirga sp. MEBiC07777]
MKKIILFIVISISLNSCKKESINSGTIHFKDLSPSSSGVTFSNTIIENDTLNYFNYPFLYLGSGVSSGDINNDGLPDLYFTGNLASNKLYLNKGNLKFEDITESAGVTGDSRWYSGTTMADVNNDGFLDIYLSVSGKSGNSANQLFINNGNNTFSEQAEAFGIADKSKSIQSTFFDYNNDGFLDLFVANYPTVLVSMGNMYYKSKMDKNKFEDSGHLYKNNGDGTFSDVTTQTGVQRFGLTLGIVASDFNNDGYKDLYLSNDFNVPDYLYLNNGDGTFNEVSNQVSRHTSMFGMGIDASDFNNDGLTDLLQVDMTAEDYNRSKTNMASMSPETFYQAVNLGFNHQYMQNSLQLNNGVNEENLPILSDISRFAGMATTDWSWGALFSDFDNDGWKDVFISNGVKRDVNNNDVNAEYKTERLFGEKKEPDFKRLPSTPISNYAYKNNGNFKFTKVTKDWQLDKKGFSNGFTSVDLDNDGDLDLVINNMDDYASIYINEAQKTKSSYLKIKLGGLPNNPFGIGTKIIIKTNGLEQTQELTTTRGYQSSTEPIFHFGVGKYDIIDELKIIWPNANEQLLKNIDANQLLKVDFKNSHSTQKTPSIKNRFKDITNTSGITFSHNEDFYDDFEFEPLLPHKYSNSGPALTVGDVNGDGLEDFFIGNAAGSSGVLYVQNDDNTFKIIEGPWNEDLQYEDTGALLFDADNDNDLDLYVVNGGNDKNKPQTYYQDRLYINTPEGFIKTEHTLPEITASGQNIISGDYDNDGDLDLFIGGRITPGKYPYPAKSYILRNEGGKDTNIKYKNVTPELAPDLNSAGLVTSAIWDDYNGDNKLDLIITGEWMPVRFFKNTGASFEEETKKLGLSNYTGWWYSLEKLDVDNDGDMDYLAGNLGLNYKYKASHKEPFQVYANDFDENGSSDIVLSYEKNGIKLPLRGRECSSQQVPVIKKRFKTFESFANANLIDIYGEGMLEGSLSYTANTFAHHLIKNDGKGSFSFHKLPNRSQFSSINKFINFDYNGDKYPDLLIGGNLYGAEVETPRNDASLTAVLVGSPDGFSVLSSEKTGLFISGEIKDIKSIRLGRNKTPAFLIAPNNNTLKLLTLNKN